MLWSCSFRRRCQSQLWFKNELQRLYIPISKTFSFLFILFLTDFCSSCLVTTASWSRARFSFIFIPEFFFLCPLLFLCFLEVEWEPSRSEVLVRCRQGWGWEVGTGCTGVCCVYSVQIIACFSAFSIEHKKEEKKIQDKFNTAIR